MVVVVTAGCVYTTVGELTTTGVSTTVVRGAGSVTVSRVVKQLCKLSPAKNRAASRKEVFIVYVFYLF